MIYKVERRQGSYGEAIGILQVEGLVPCIPGSVSNASAAVKKGFYGFM